MLNITMYVKIIVTCQKSNHEHSHTSSLRWLHQGDAVKNKQKIR